MLFESNRDIVVRSLRGHSIEFKKGVPTQVPRIMHEEVMEKGILPVEDNGKPVDPVTADIGEAKPKIVLAPVEELDRADQILVVIEALVKRNNPVDFTASGTPSPLAVSTVLGWRTDLKEVRAIWEKNRERLLKQ